MFEFLTDINQRLFDRYLTLERNIKAASNSFYDAYLDLQEQYVRDVVIDFGLPLESRETCGAMLRRQDIASIFKDTLNVDDFTFSKMLDYTLKVNAHKHKGEKHIQIDTIIAYMRIIYNVGCMYWNYAPVTLDEILKTKEQRIDKK